MGLYEIHQHFSTALTVFSLDLIKPPLRHMADSSLNLEVPPVWLKPSECTSAELLARFKRGQVCVMPADHVLDPRILRLSTSTLSTEQGDVKVVRTNLLCLKISPHLVPCIFTCRTVRDAQSTSLACHLFAPLLIYCRMHHRFVWSPSLYRII